MNELNTFIAAMHANHMQNAESHYVRHSGQHCFSEDFSPVNKFIYEYFLFNCLCAVDWESSLMKKEIVQSNKWDLGELELQEAFLSFVFSRIRDCNLNLAQRAFSILGNYVSLVFFEADDVSDQGVEYNRNAIDNRKEFFCYNKLLMQSLGSQDCFKSDVNCHYIRSALRSLCKIKTNIFYDAKVFDARRDFRQRQRVEYYEAFIRSLNSVFFLLIGQAQAGSDVSPLPIEIQGHGTKRIDVPAILRLRKVRSLKRFDSHLIRELRNNASYQEVSDHKGAMFYPSAGMGNSSTGSDFIFPALIGSQHCSSLHFYDSRMDLNLRQFRQDMQDIGADVVQINQSDPNTRVADISFMGERRFMWFHTKDNMEFLQIADPINFLFTRGDSIEGGCEMHWGYHDLWRVLEKADRSLGLHFMSDRCKIGLPPSLEKIGHNIALPLGRMYFYAFISGDLFECLIMESKAAVGVR
jgi:hypothetical protein